MAHVNHFTFCILGLGLFLGIKLSNAQSYKAAVVAFRQDGADVRDLPNEIEDKNKDRYVALITDLRTAGAEIIVFPEKGITTLSPDKIDHRIHLEAYSIDVPNPSPQANFSNIILAGISAAAKSNQAYVVINVLEKRKSDKKDEMNYFSTNLVFDKQGKLISKCRKKHLYEEKKYSESSTNELCTFEASFSENRKVKFSLLFDTDLLSAIDETIYNAIVTSSLPNKLPFFFGLSLQAGFSVRNQINLLASGYTDPDSGYGGTGIYFRNGTSKVTIGSEAFLISDVPLQQSREKHIDVKVLLPATNLLQGISYDNLNKSGLSTHNKSVKEQFSKGSYCNMKLDINGDNIFPYEWLAFSDKTNIMGNFVDVLVCALIKSNINRNQKGIVNGANIEILKKGKVTQILPLSLEVRSDGTLVPANFHYTEEKNSGDTTITMQLTEPKDLQGFGIIIVSHSTSIRVTQMVLIGSLSFLAYFRMGLFI